MGIKEAFRNLTKFEICLWLFSLSAVTLSFVFSAEKDALTLIASLIGVTALIFVAKGLVLGQLLTLAFAIVYGIISLKFHYYGELITYMGMTAPIAVLSVISWLRHPYRETKVVEVSRVTARAFVLLFILSATVTAAFYFILEALGTSNLIFSTLSVTTSFLASSLTFLRSPYYAIAYAANDIILIVLWIMAAIADISFLPMVACFAAFLANDIYGFISWQRIEKIKRRESDELPKTGYNALLTRMFKFALPDTRKLGTSIF